MGKRWNFKPPSFPNLARSLVPIPMDDGVRQRSPLYTPSLWETWTAWLRYHTIQFRWDIERTLARLLHRRWIGK
jgi:hypothetical protein